MKFWIHTFLFSFLSVACFSQGTNQIADRKIKSITQHTVDERKENKNVRTNFISYDKKGNVLKAIEYNEDSVITKWEEYTYNKRNDVTLFRELDASGKQIKKVVTIYNSFGYKIEEKLFNACDLITERSVFTYNNFNDKVSETVYDQNEKLKSKSVYEYELKGMIKRKVIYSPENKLIYERTYNYVY